MNALFLTIKQQMRGRVAKAGYWTLSGYAAGQVLRFASNLIMTRLLVPEMFGVMALANVLYTGLHLFSDFGLGLNIIQSRRGQEVVFLNTIWTIQIFRGLVIWLFSIVLSLFLYYGVSLHWLPKDSAYANSAMPYIIVALCFCAVISGFESTKLPIASRQLANKYITIIELSSQATGIVMMIALAWYKQTIWALVLGALVTSLLRMSLSHLVLPGPVNKIHWDRQVFDEIFHFGKWVFLTSILGFLVMNGDRLVLGDLLDSKTMGLYAIAFFLVNAIQLVFYRIMGGVAFPLFSEVVRERIEELSAVYYRFRLYLDLPVLFFAGFFFACGEILISLLYDSRYAQSGAMFTVLSLSLIEARYYLSGRCFIALGKPKLLLPIYVVRLFVIYGFVPVIFKMYGIGGAIWAIALGPLLSVPLVFYFMMKNRIFNIKYEILVLSSLLLGYLVGLAMKLFL